MDQDRIATSVLWILRVGVAMCFLGHGSFGIITKQAWVPYFGVAGISEPWAWRLMPWVGTMDVTLAFLALIWPCRVLFVWGAVWAVWTALLRPLAGQGWSEFYERAGNYGVSLGILAIVGLAAPWFSRLPDQWPALTERVRSRLAWTLRIATATLLAGHAGCAVFLQKAGLAKLYSPFFAASSHEVMMPIGYAEFGLALLVFIVPKPSILVGVCIWKLASELLFLLGGTAAPMFEVIERGGSYTVPLALAVLLWQRQAQSVPSLKPSPAR